MLRSQSTSCGRRRTCTRNGRAPANWTIRPRSNYSSASFQALATSRRNSRSTATPSLRCLRRSAPASCLLVHSQAGAFGWPVADARPDLVRAILAIEPNGPPAHGVEFTGAPGWFKEGPIALTYGITSAPLNYSPPVKDASDMKFVREEKAEGPDLITCWKQAEPARQLPNLQRMPILILMAEASYHAPYDHCTVKYLQQAGVKPTFIRLADRGVKGNSHVMMMEKNNKDSAAVIAEWLEKSVAAAK